MFLRLFYGVLLSLEKFRQSVEFFSAKVSNLIMDSLIVANFTHPKIIKGILEKKGDFAYYFLRCH